MHIIIYKQVYTIIISYYLLLLQFYSVAIHPQNYSVISMIAQVSSYCTLMVHWHLVSVAKLSTYTK